MKLDAVPDRPRRLVVYVRQSVEREGSISPEVQERACRDYVLSRGDEVVEVIPDVGVSGLKWDRRPGVQRAMKLVADGEADGIVVWRWSRLSRSRLHQAVAIDAVESAGGVIESATEPFDTATAGGRFGREVMLAAAAFESQQKAEQWADAHRRRLDRGLPASGGQRLGYRIDDGRYVPDESAPIVAEMYARYLAGHGLEKVADWLLTLGVVSPKTGRRWTKRGVGYFLDSGFAAGLLLVRGEYSEGAHEPIISGEVWADYLAERERRRITAPRLLHPTTRLAGILRCAGCGRSMTLHYLTRQSVRYRCSTRGCQEPAVIRVKIAEEAARAKLAELAAEVDAEVPETSPAGVVLRERLEREVAKAHRALTRLTVDLASEDIPAAAFREAKDELERDLARRQAELRQIEVQDRRAAMAPASAAGLLAAWDEADHGDVNAVVRELLCGKVFRGGHIEFREAWRAQ